MDTFWFNRPWLYMTCHFALFKFFFTFGFNMLFCSMLCRLLTIGKDYKKPFTGIHYWLMRANFYWGSRLLMWNSSGISWVYEEKPKICYKKYSFRANYFIHSPMMTIGVGCLVRYCYCL